MGFAFYFRKCLLGCGHCLPYELNKIKNDNLKQDIEFYLTQNKELNTLIELKKEFKPILFSKKTEQLEPWLRKSRALNIIEINSFVNLIESGIEDVKNAITYNYSNGLTEGLNNKTKVIKRQMYGRCSFDLLRLKILA